MKGRNRWFYGPGGLILTFVLIALGGFFAITGGVHLGALFILGAGGFGLFDRLRRTKKIG